MSLSIRRKLASPRGSTLTPMTSDLSAHAVMISSLFVSSAR
jgi:hypothetical protein